MNVSSSFEKLKAKQYHLTARQRLIVVVTIGIVALLITVYATESEVTVEPTLPRSNSQKIVIPPNKPVTPIGHQVTQVNQVNQTMRNPFALPPDMKEQKSKADLVFPEAPNNIPATVPKQVGASKSQEKFKLTGIVSTADQDLAVIMFANKSKAYKVNDVVGTYQLTNISQDAIILTDANHTLVLQLEPTGQKGGTNGGK